ncbi:hypothetical protein EVAR_97451_1 [Eumeta japonica]|uniref:Uncharacterized protein n=1 Tax=Eumeta variegata TaxID=151549 RepID=A0A4C1WYU9_EUMVA|nr:hypothetical protein EVAR_97451_1 [Eumeta japonica]
MFDIFEPKGKPLPHKRESACGNWSVHDAPHAGGKSAKIGRTCMAVSAARVSGYSRRAGAGPRRVIPERDGVQQRQMVEGVIVQSTKLCRSEEVHHQNYHSWTKPMKTLPTTRRCRGRMSQLKVNNSVGPLMPAVINAAVNSHWSSVQR